LKSGDCICHKGSGYLPARITRIAAIREKKESGTPGAAITKVQFPSNQEYNKISRQKKTPNVPGWVKEEDVVKLHAES